MATDEAHAASCAASAVHEGGVPAAVARLGPRLARLLQANVSGECAFTSTHVNSLPENSENCAGPEQFTQYMPAGVRDLPMAALQRRDVHSGAVPCERASRSRQSTSVWSAAGRSICDSAASSAASYCHICDANAAHSFTARLPASSFLFTMASIAASRHENWSLPQRHIRREETWVGHRWHTFNSAADGEDGPAGTQPANQRYADSAPSAAGTGRRLPLTGPELPAGCGTSAGCPAGG